MRGGSALIDRPRAGEGGGGNRRRRRRVGQVAVSRRRLVGCSILALATAGAAAVVANRPDALASVDAAATRYLESVDVAYGPLKISLGPLFEGQQQWLEGTRPSQQYAGQLSSALPEFEKVEDAMAKLSPGEFPVAHRFFSATASLYVEFVRTEQMAVATSDQEERAQLDLMARRIRVLGDRIYDRGRAALDPDIFEAPKPNVELRYPAEVPDFAAEGLAPGPPLDDPAPAAERNTRLRRERPRQPEAAWRAAVADLAIPTASVVEQAIAVGDAMELRDLARQLTGAARLLESVPDPDGDRERAAALRLGILLRAEGARVAQAAVLLGDAHGPEALKSMAARLVAVGQSVESQSD